jgi:alanine racemase
VDTPRWRAHLERVLTAYGVGLVPVCKGNGYGLGVARLAAEAARLRVSAVAVGTEWELTEVLPRFAGEVLVLTPWHGATGGPPTSVAPEPRVLRTVAHLAAVRQLLTARVGVVVELRTDVRRHGLSDAEIVGVAPLLAAKRELIAGWALHLPIDRPGGVNPLREVAGWVDRLRGLDLPVDALWVSHLTSAEVVRLGASLPGVAIRPRVGTDLWLGDRAALRVTGTVLDVHALGRGQRSGYRQRRAAAAGHIVVVAGGTAHGIALEAPRAVRGPLPRVKALGMGILAAGNASLSPFAYRGKARWFIEPPHMQVSLLFLPSDVTPPALGEELDAQVRMTTLHPDAVLDCAPASSG